MDPRLTQLLDIIRQLPQARQRDATDMITTLLDDPEETFAAQHASFKALFESVDATEISDWGVPPGMLSVRIKARNPIEPGVALTNALASALERLTIATPDRQDAVRLLLGHMIENESQELDLTPEDTIALKRLIDQSKAEFDAGLGIAWTPGEPLTGRSNYRRSDK